MSRTHCGGLAPKTTEAAISEESETAARYRRRAEELRTIAASSKDPAQKLALKKLAANGTFVEPARVGGASALWIEGGPHVLTWIDRDSGYRERPILVRGNVLLWLRGGLTLRLEGPLSKAQALELARSVR